MKRALVVVVAACGDNDFEDLPYYGWDDTQALGAFRLDGVAPDDPALLRELAHAGETVTLFYAHARPDAVSIDTIETVLARAEATLSFADLAAGGEPRRAVCLSFDDDEVEAWFAMRDRFEQHHAHVTFFVTRYHELSADQRAMLHALAADGHSIEAHGVDHANALDYIPEHGLEAFLDEEVQPSIDVLRADGFDPVAYAHPNGGHTRELDAALASRVRFTRSISGIPK